MTPEECQEMHDALVKLSTLSIMLGNMLASTRAGWDEGITCEGALGPINQIAKQIGEAIPARYLPVYMPKLKLEYRKESEMEE